MMDYAVIANNEIKGLVRTNEQAQVVAKAWSNGRFEEAKVVYFPDLSLQGHWIKGERIS